ncbi:MAG: IS21 family transposase [Bacteroidales bacterium]
MVTDKQVRRLFKEMGEERNLKKAALKSGMDVKTARKYYRAGKFPSEMRKKHSWRTRKDPFEAINEEIAEMLREKPGIEGKTLFNYFMEKYPEKYHVGQLRTFQRKIKAWRALEGPPKEIFFPQKHYPGVLGASDFTHMNKLNITIKGEKFNHLLYHFVLTYSNWETVNLCYSESFESLSEGLQKALWQLGKAPEKHRTDRLTSAINKDCSRDKFTRSYNALVEHYGMKGQATNPGSGHENGDVEQRHYRIKRAIEQELILRDSRDFESVEEYKRFLENLMNKLNSGREKHLKEEMPVMRELPAKKLNTQKRLILKVGKNSTINVRDNTYSVNSRLIGEKVEARLNADTIEIWYGQKRVDTLPRLRGKSKSAVNYRHIIGSLLRKPGAFENYKYRDDLFPSTIFRITYDYLKKKYPGTGNRKYIEVLNLAAKETEEEVEKVLKYLLEKEYEPTGENILEVLTSKEKRSCDVNAGVVFVNLRDYDAVLGEGRCAK